MVFSLQGVSLGAHLALPRFPSGLDHGRIDEKLFSLAQRDLYHADRGDISSLNAPYGKERLMGRLHMLGLTALWYGALAVNIAAVALAIFFPPLSLALRITIIGVAALLQVATTMAVSDWKFRDGPSLREVATCVDRLQKTTSREAVAEQLLNYGSDYYEGAERKEKPDDDLGTGGLLGVLWSYGLMDQELIQKVFVARALLVKLSEQCKVSAIVLPELGSKEATLAYKKRIYYTIKEEVVKLLPEDQKERSKLFHLWPLARHWKAKDRYSELPSATTAIFK